MPHSLENASPLALRLRKLTRRDFPLLGGWLAQPHVARWWDDDTSPAAIEAAYGSTVDGTEPSAVFVALADARPIGLVQCYRLAAYPQYLDELASIGIDVPTDAFSIDYFIGEPDLLRQGWGAAMIRACVQAIWRDCATAPAVIVPVNLANAASMRVLERAGFEPVGEGPLEPDNPIDDRAHRIYRIDRPGTGDVCSARSETRSS